MSELQGTPWAPQPLPATAQQQVATVCATAKSQQETVDAIRAWMNTNGIAYGPFDWSCVEPYMPAGWKPQI